MNKKFYPLFKGSFMEIKKLPYLEKELIILGKSNAGKSTLINTLLSNNICYTSKTPGRTIAINVITIDKAQLKAIIDVPGYGFAKSPAEFRQKWESLLPSYLEATNRCARRAWVLMPAYNACSPADQEVIDLLALSGVQIRIIITKTDKLKLKDMQNKSDEVKKIFSLYQGISIFSFSKYDNPLNWLPLKKDMEEYFTS